LKGGIKMAFTKKEMQLIEREERRKKPLLTKKFEGFRKKKSGKYVMLLRHKKKRTLEEHPVSTNLLKFRLKVAKS
jgi:hypothetical protein